MLLEKMRNNCRNKKSLALALAFIVMISMLSMGAIYDMETKTVTLITRNAFEGIENNRDIVTRKTTVEEFLEEQEIVLEKDDVLNADLSEELYPKQIITVEKSRMIEIHCDGQTSFKKAVKKTVGEALKDAGIIVSNTDIVTPSVSSDVTPEMVITVDRVEIKEETVDTEIPYQSVKEPDPTRYLGESAAKQYGVPGVKRDVYKVTRINGEETARELISSGTEKEPVSEIILTGTKQHERIINKKQALAAANGGFRDAGEEIEATSSQKGFSYSKVLNVTATAYDPSPETNAGYSKTALGLTPEYGVVAVDPRVIPLGTKLYIESSDGGASWVYGYCIAGDTGGAIKGNRVDLCYNTKSECIQFGRRSATVYILN